MPSQCSCTNAAREKSETIFFGGGGEGRAWSRIPLSARTGGTGPALAFHTIGVESCCNGVQPLFQKFLDPPLQDPYFAPRCYCAISKTYKGSVSVFKVTEPHFWSLRILKYFLLLRSIQSSVFSVTPPLLLAGFSRFCNLLFFFRGSDLLHWIHHAWRQSNFFCICCFT